jgi:hypothetical protein
MFGKLTICLEVQIPISGDFRKATLLAQYCMRDDAEQIAENFYVANRDSLNRNHCAAYWQSDKVPL